MTLNRREISQSISAIEDRASGALAKLKTLYHADSFRNSVCFTGPGGAGKSTLVSNLVLRAAKAKSIAWVACDPSSAKTGGSVLGDRIRLSGAETPENVFVRSMSTRSASAYSQAIRDVEVYLESLFDEVWVETAGSGQTQTEISLVSGMTVLVLQPETGDEVQWMKSGLQEEVDLFIVNKADLAGADVMRQLLIEQGAPEDRVIEVSSKREQGFEDLLSRIESVRASLDWQERKQKLHEAHARALFMEKERVRLEAEFEKQKAQLMKNPY